VKHKIVEVTWLDARSEAGWVPGDGENRPVTTYGILGRTTKTCLILWSSYDPQEKTYGDRHRIPKGMVLKKKVLAEIEV
jgi:hypothetical protein